MPVGVHYLERLGSGGMEDERGSVVLKSNETQWRDNGTRLKQVWVVAHLRIYIYIYIN